LKVEVKNIELIFGNLKANKDASDVKNIKGNR